MVHKHILVQTLPALGNLNPCLCFAKNLARMGVKVTMLVSASVQDRIGKDDLAMSNIRIVAFSDGYDDGLKFGPKFNYGDFVYQVKTRGSKALSEIITSSAQEGSPVTGLVYSMLQTWAAELARSFSIPSTVIWTQPATLFAIYCNYFYGDDNAIKDIIDDAKREVQFHGCLRLTSQDLPSFMEPSNPASSSQLSQLKTQLETLDLEIKPKVVVNTFDELESNALQAINRYHLIAIGPLVPSSYLDRKDKPKSKDKYVEWLDTNQQKSVVYLAFGSFLPLPEGQMEEIAVSLLESGRPFLWVIRAKEDHEKEEDKFFSYKKELDKLGMIVPWCSQVEVLAHPSVGCFLTHCGWNSSLESLVSGVPVVGIPQFADQPTNAKLLQDEFKIGVRAKANDKGVVVKDEMKRCIDLVIGCDEMRNNAIKWKSLAKEATEENGSSFNNMKAFLDEFE